MEDRGMVSCEPGNPGYALDAAGSMADNESDLETDGLEVALDALCRRHCGSEASLNSKEYCSAFCQLVEEYTAQWHVPLPQLKVLRTALSNFTKATTAFPDDCQHIHYVLSSMALSFFELMLFFSKEEFVEEPLKDILDSFQRCHTRLLRHRNIYLQHLKQIIKAGGPWENPVLQGILKETDVPPNEIQDFLSSELPIFLELRVRYLQACERMQEAMALSKSCLENREAGKHLYFQQAYLTCLYKASLYENFHKEMAEIDGRDAVEIICNTEKVEKDELLLSLCNAFLTQQLHNGDMYYIWDLVFIWSRLHLRAYPSRQGFLAECLELASSATNVRAIFPFIKLLTTELGAEGVQVCVELCARALQLCDTQADTVTQSLVYKTIAFLLPHDLEICRACALLVFCQERSLEAYRTVCLLYMHPDQEPHPHNNPVPTCIRFHIFQMLKERLCFDPEFWNLLTIRTHCVELMNDHVVKAAVLNEMKEEEEEQYNEELLSSNCINESCTQGFSSYRHTDPGFFSENFREKQVVFKEERSWVAPTKKAKRRNWRHRVRKRKHYYDDFDYSDDPEITYNVKSPCLRSNSMYSLRGKQSDKDTSSSVKVAMTNKREYLSRCVKSQIFKRKGRKSRWLQGIPRQDQVQTCRDKMGIVRGTKRGRKPFSKLELSYPDNEMALTEHDCGFQKEPTSEDKEQDVHHLEIELKIKSEQEEVPLQQLNVSERTEREPSNMACDSILSEQKQEESQLLIGPQLSKEPSDEHQPAVEANPELDGSLLDLLDCPIELFHTYSNKSKTSDIEGPPEAIERDELNGNTKDFQPELETKVSPTEVKVPRTWKDKSLRTQQYAHLTFHCNICSKDYKGLNVMRHALSHLKRRKLKCILCGKRFKQHPLAKKHILDHIDAMCKQKCKNKTLAANGTIDNGADQSQPQPEEQQTLPPEVDAPEQKKKTKILFSSLSREQRILRNLRTLIKKTTVLHKKLHKTNSVIFEHLDFKDEQVVIKEGFAVVRVPAPVEKDGAGEGVREETPPNENGCGVEIAYHLCPSDSCDRVFLKVNSTLTKHAIKCHINEEKVLEKTFVWAKRKCSICARPIQFLQHYKDHMKLHSDPLPHFCYHLECKQRFLTLQELRDHVYTHQPFRPQCPFTECEKLFSGSQGLYDHEWRHYVPAPQRDDLEHGLRHNTESDEAPWKQRVKVEKLWLQNSKVQREVVGTNVWVPSPERSQTEDQVTEVNANVQNLWTASNCSEETIGHVDVDDSKATINGYEPGTSSPEVSLSSSCPISTNSSKKLLRKAAAEVDPLDVRHLEDLTTMVEGLARNIAEPHIEEHKTFKPEDPSYATLVKAPFTRPPPSTYLDESMLCMRKRRTVDEPPPRKYVAWNHKKKETDPELQTGKSSGPPEKIRHRCDKCLSSFSSPEDLQKHQSLNSCSSLFGFDSDDES